VLYIKLVAYMQDFHCKSFTISCIILYTSLFTKNGSNDNIHTKPYTHAHTIEEKEKQLDLRP